jgi:hypothetical protein
MTKSQTPEQIIAQVVGYAVQAVDQLTFDERADMVAKVADGVREALKTERTIGAPEGREWEMERLGEVRDVAQGYADEALTIAQSRKSR